MSWDLRSYPLRANQINQIHYVNANFYLYSQDLMCPFWKCILGLVHIVDEFAQSREVITMPSHHSRATVWLLLDAA
jgi:hypothetical protein